MLRVFAMSQQLLVLYRSFTNFGDLIDLLLVDRALWEGLVAGEEKYVENALVGDFLKIDHVSSVKDIIDDCKVYDDDSLINAARAILQAHGESHFGNVNLRPLLKCIVYGKEDSDDEGSGGRS